MREEEMRTGAGACFHSRSLGPQRYSQVKNAALHREPTGSSEALPPLPHTPGALHITSGRGVPWRSVQTLNPRLSASSPRFNTCKLCDLGQVT